MANVSPQFTPQELLEVDVEVHVFDVPSAEDSVLVVQFQSGGLISYRKADGAHLHTLNNAEGFARKLAQLGIEIS